MDDAATDIVIACCRDEADIIGPFIDFYLDQGFDWICLVDNGSKDDTVAQVLAHPHRNHVLLHSDPRLGYDIRLLEYYHLFVRHASRWVFFIDIDEFILIPGGIKTFAAQLPADATVLEIPTAEMIPDFSAPEGTSSLLWTRREANPADEIKVVWKAGVPSKIYCGKHAIEGTLIVPYCDARLLIRHYHTRSPLQLRKKLQNRVETETAITRIPGAANELSVFPHEHRLSWFEESKQLLITDGWARERERLEGVQWVTDTAVRDWYRQRGTGEFVDLPGAARCGAQR